MGEYKKRVLLISNSIDHVMAGGWTRYAPKHTEFHYGVLKAFAYISPRKWKADENRAKIPKDSLAYILPGELLCQMKPRWSSPGGKLLWQECQGKYIHHYKPLRFPDFSPAGS